MCAGSFFMSHAQYFSASAIETFVTGKRSFSGGTALPVNFAHSTSVTGVLPIETLLPFAPKTGKKAALLSRSPGRKRESVKRAIEASMRCSRSRSISSTITCISSTLDWCRAVRFSSSNLAYFRATTAS